MKQKNLQFGGASVLASLLLLRMAAQAQVNGGSNGSDGALTNYPWGFYRVSVP
jgi:hypothetical protein